MLVKKKKTSKVIETSWFKYLLPCCLFRYLSLIITNLLFYAEKKHHDCLQGAGGTQSPPVSKHSLLLFYQQAASVNWLLLVLNPNKKKCEYCFRSSLWNLTLNNVFTKSKKWGVFIDGPDGSQQPVVHPVFRLSEVSVWMFVCLFFFTDFSTHMFNLTAFYLKSYKISKEKSNPVVLSRVLNEWLTVSCRT